jgi:hypothetical protein
LRINFQEWKFQLTTLNHNTVHDERFLSSVIVLLVLCQNQLTNTNKDLRLPIDEQYYKLLPITNVKNINRFKYAKTCAYFHHRACNLWNTNESKTNSSYKSNHKIDNWSNWNPKSTLKVLIWIQSKVKYESFRLRCNSTKEISSCNKRNQNWKRSDYSGKWFSKALPKNID